MDGRPLTRDRLARVLGAAVASFEAPAASAFRYKMATGCRLDVAFDGGATRSVFVKRASMRDLPHARDKFAHAPHKLARDVASYEVEMGFLRSRARQLLRPTCRTPEPLDVTLRAVPAFPLDSAFLAVLEDLGGLRQVGLLGRGDLDAALKYAARWHAFFWNGRVGRLGSGAAEASALDRVVWDAATWWAPKRQAPDMLERVASAYAAADVAGDFGAVLRELHAPLPAGLRDVAALADLGDRLQAAARALAAETHLRGIPRPVRVGVPSRDPIAI